MRCCACLGLPRNKHPIPCIRLLYVAIPLPKGKFIDHEWDKDGPKFPMGLSGHNYQTEKEALTYYLDQMKANCDNKC